MYIMKSVLAFIFGVLISTTAYGQTNVKSYREWKGDRVLRAEMRVNYLKAQIAFQKTQRTVANGLDPNLKQRSSTEAVSSQNLNVERLENQLREEIYGLEIAKDLSVTDYFVGYLTKVENQQSAFHEVAGKLTSEEIAELMMAYANSMFVGGGVSGNSPSTSVSSKEIGK